MSHSSSGSGSSGGSGSGSSRTGCSNDRSSSIEERVCDTLLDVSARRVSFTQCLIPRLPKQPLGNLQLSVWFCALLRVCSGCASLRYAICEPMLYALDDRSQKTSTRPGQTDGAALLPPDNIALISGLLVFI